MLWFGFTFSDIDCNSSIKYGNDPANVDVPVGLHCKPGYNMLHVHLNSFALVYILTINRCPIYSNPAILMTVFFPAEEDASGPVFSSLRHILKVSCICLSHVNVILYLNVNVDLCFNVLTY